MQQSTIHKTSDGKRKVKGRKKPQQVRQAKARTKSLIKKLNHTHTPQGLG